MSTQSHRIRIRKARRALCAAHLSAYLLDHPKTVSPEVALRFLQFGRKPADLIKFLATEAASKQAMQIPEHIKIQGRALFNQWMRGYKIRKKIFEGIKLQHAQRKARRISRRAA